MKTITCCHKDCGISFGVPEGWYNRRKKDGFTFTCPNGHEQSFTVGKTELDKMTERCLGSCHTEGQGAFVRW